MTNNKPNMNKQWHSRIGVKFSLKIYWQFVRVSVWLLIRNHKVAGDSFLKLAKRIEKLYLLSGKNFTVSYLKEAHRLTMKTLAGEQPKSLLEPRVAMRRGLPLIIPGDLRLLIEAKDVRVVKAALTLLSVFRVIPATPKLKLETITDPHKGLVTDLPEMGLVMQKLLNITRGNPGYTYFQESNKSSVFARARDLLRLSTAGPNERFQLTGYPSDALAFDENPGLLKWFEIFCLNTNHKDLLHKLRSEIAFIKNNQSKLLLNNFNMKDWLDKWGHGTEWSSLKLGKLSLKMEAAGKVRVFAIVDAWTQTALAPLHTALFSILSEIKQDGTFNQLKPIKILMDKGLMEWYSFDLSAATDRLPIDLQVHLLSLLYNNKDTALAWKGLLVDRDYHLEAKKFSYANGKYRYAVGQPMGALSSWAMLALTHHMIVQVAALRVNHQGWFEDYALLGDDISIANREVAQAYLQLMEQLGVEINLSKSVVSSIGGCEFAKKVIVNGIDYSPIGVKELFEFIYSPRHFKDLVLNNRLLSINLGTEDLDFSAASTFLQDLIDNCKPPVSSPRWIDKVRSTLWDLYGIFGLNLTEGLSPTITSQAIDSLSCEELQIFRDSLYEFLKIRVAHESFKAQADDVQMYSSLRRFLSFGTYAAHFPSMENILGQYSEDMMRHQYRPFIEFWKELEIQDLAKLAFSDLTYIGDPRLKFAKTVPKAGRSKSLDLSRQFLSDLGQKSPHIFMKMMRNSQAFSSFK